MQKLSLVPATTVSNVRSPTQPMLELGKYFRPKRTPLPFAFAHVEKWHNFNQLINRNVARVNNFERPSHFMTSQELAFEFVGPLLNQIGLSVRFVEGNNSALPFIGNSDLILCDSTDAIEIPLMVGLNYSDLSLEVDLVGSVRGSSNASQSSFGSLERLVEDFESNKDEVLRCVQGLCHVMLINNLAFGYLSSETTSRFVNIVPHGSGLDLRISDPLDSHEVCHALIAVSIEAYYGKPPLRYNRGFDAFPEAVEDPNVEPLSSFDEGSAGKIKWWIASRVSRHHYTIGINHSALTSDELPPRLEVPASKYPTSVWRSGSVTIDGIETVPSLLKISTEETSIRRESSMLQYLCDKGVRHIPKTILYAHILGNDFHVLALEAIGRELLPNDISLPEVEGELFAALDELHKCGVMLMNISLESFLIHYGESPSALPTVRIINLAHSKLYRRIPEVAREKERYKLRKMLAQIQERITDPCP